MEHLIPHLQYLEEDPDSEDDDFDLPQRYRTRASSAPPAREMFMGAYRNIREINYETTSSSIDEVPDVLPREPLYRNARRSQEREEERAHLRTTRRHPRKFHPDSLGYQAVIDDFLSNVSGSSTSRDSLPSLIQTSKESTAGHRSTNYLPNDQRFNAMPSASSTTPASQPTTKATYDQKNSVPKAPMNPITAQKTTLNSVFGVANDVFASDDRGTQYSPPNADHSAANGSHSNKGSNDAGDPSAFGINQQKSKSPDRLDFTERTPAKSPDRYDSAERDDFTKNFVRSLSGGLVGAHIHGINSSKEPATSPSTKNNSVGKDSESVNFLGQQVKYLTEKEVANGSLVGARVSLQSRSTWWHAEVEDFIGDQNASEYVLAYDSGHIKAVDLHPSSQKCVLLERVVDAHSSDATGGLVRLHKIFSTLIISIQSLISATSLRNY
jgi:hypothetical protein